MGNCRTKAAGVCRQLLASSCSCQLTWMLLGPTQYALAGSWGSKLGMTLLAISRTASDP